MTTHAASRVGLSNMLKMEITLVIVVVTQLPPFTIAVGVAGTVGSIPRTVLINPVNTEIKNSKIICLLSPNIYA
jgi:hypothetical protein